MSNNNHYIKSKEDNDEQQSQASQLIGNNHDLTTQILLCLPPNSISNLKLTSKLWFSIFYDPKFIKSHTLHHPQTIKGLFLHHSSLPPHNLSHEYIACEPSNDINNKVDGNNNNNNNSPIQFVKAQNFLGLNILQSCNGLLLCSSYDFEHFVCNPTTLQRRLVVLPKGVCNGGDFGFSLAFDPKISPWYKVVCVRKVFGQQSRYQVEVYSSSTNLWKTVGEPFFEPDVLHFKHGVFCKRAIHWLKSKSNCLYFDIDSELIKSTPEPPQWKQCPSYSHEYFGTANDHLYFIVKRRLPNFTLLQMKADYSGWFVKCVVNLDTLAKDFPIMARNFDNTPQFLPHYECNVLCITGSEGRSDINEDDNVELVLSMPGKIVRFDPRSNDSTELGRLPLYPYNDSVWYKDFSVNEYFETICPV